MVRMILLVILMQSCVTLVHDRNRLLKKVSTDEKQKSVKTDGFYYSELEESDSIKSISALILYDDNFMVNLGVYDGISDTYCGMKKYYNINSYEEAKLKLKLYLEYLKNTDKSYSSCKIKDNDFDKKGLFQIKNDSIFLQYYQAEPKDLEHDSFNDYYLYELRGTIISSEEFIITKKINYRKNSVENISLMYKFEKNQNIPEVKRIFNKKNRVKN